MNLFNVYPRYDIELVKGKDCYVWDKDNKKYLDFYGGHAVISIGHSHPHFIEKIQKELGAIAFYSNSIQVPVQEQLAEKLGHMSGYDDYNLFLCNSGAEANENALKLASFYNGRKKIVAFSNSFHGRTSLAAAVTDNKAIKAPVNNDHTIEFLPFNDEDSLEKYINKETCAVIIEGIQGVSGIHVPNAIFLQKIRSLCDQHNVIFIVDEIQSGYGRTGKFFAHQHAAIKPDIITIAKGMGNGFPVAGVLINPKIESKPGLLGTTFGGGYLACAAALAVLETIEKSMLIPNAGILGQYLINELSGIKQIEHVRGLGLMIGIELPAAEVIRECLLKDHGIFTGISADKKTLRLLPPLSVSKLDISTFIQALYHVLN